MRSIGEPGKRRGNSQPAAAWKDHRSSSTTASCSARAMAVCMPRIWRAEPNCGSSSSVKRWWLRPPLADSKSLLAAKKARYLQSKDEGRPKRESICRLARLAALKGGSLTTEIKFEQETLKPGNNAGRMIPKPACQKNQQFSWLHGFLLNPIMSGWGKAPLAGTT